MKLYRNILTVEAGILIEKGLLSLPNYYKMSNRGKIDVVRRGCKNTPALVRYDSLPVNIQQKLNPDKKNLYDAVRNDLLESHISHDARISDFFSFEYKLAGGRNLPAKKQTEYYYNALVLNAVNEIISAKRNIKAAQGSQFKINWEGISNSVNEIDRTKYPHNLPASLWGIKKAIEKYNREGLPGLINGRFGNKNTVKLKDELQEGVLFELLKHNVDDVLVCKLYNHKAAQEQWQRITTGTVSNWRTKWELELHAVRYGSNSFFN
ncbi:MAG: hypothetical protein LBB41_07515 [Prevotellaceae bacterium]|jgi:hypothetical protein|nr:hypothetical protein [Prevotellaceae bacterium]